MGVGVYETLFWVGGGEWALFWVSEGEWNNILVGGDEWWWVWG